MFVKQLIICNFSWKLHEKYCPTKMKAYNDSNIGLPRTDWLVLLLFKTLKISINVLLLSNYVQNCFTTLLYTLYTLYNTLIYNLLHFVTQAFIKGLMTSVSVDWLVSYVYININNNEITNSLNCQNLAWWQRGPNLCPNW